jgi:hypothetical protein
MGISAPPKPPAYPDPTQTANTQYQYNTKSGQASQALNMVDQSNPLGSKNYFVSGVDPVTGLPTYSQNVNYTPEQQALLEQLQGTKSNVGQAGQNLSADTLSLYSTAPDLVGGANSLTQQGMDREQPYFERFQAPQRAQLDTALRNQGILPGTPAYQQQVDKQTAQQDLDKGNWLNTFQNQSFNQASQQYQLPAQMIAQLMQLGAPNALNFDQTPTANVNDPNYQQQVQQKYQADYQAYQQKVQAQNSQNAMLAGLFGNVLGGPIGGQLGSSVAGMFGPSTPGPWQTTTTIGG